MTAMAGKKPCRGEGRKAVAGGISVPVTGSGSCAARKMARRFKEAGWDVCAGQREVSRLPEL
ncbi:MAG: hypothetical protein CW342_01755 [Thermoactinomycetaceae bacterium]|nr:hypothetical protein [Thermoactinomycetaceae bacterium]